MKKILIILTILFGVHYFQKDKHNVVKVDQNALIYGIIKKENPHKNVNLVGDKHFKHKAYGFFQIRAVYLADVNKLVGKKEMRRIWGKSKLAIKDMKKTKIASWVCLKYLNHYGKAYTKKTGKMPTVEVLARIHNGGPLGYGKWDTYRYGKDVVKYSKEYQAKVKS